MIPILVFSLLLTAWFVLWASQEELPAGARFVYGIAAAVMTTLFALGLVQQVMHGH